MENRNKFLLLQINDALFPIGGYSHSYGLETYIQKGIVTDEKSAKEFISKRLRISICYNELLNVRLAWEYARDQNLEALDSLEDIVNAAKTPQEIRNASIKMGSRFTKTLSSLSLSLSSPVFWEYLERRKGKTIHHATIYGIFCAGADIPLWDTLEHYLYGQTSAMVTNCVKSIPLSQTAGQQILFEMHETMWRILEKVSMLSEEMLGLSCPGFDLRCMQHEGLYSRIYMS